MKDFSICPRCHASTCKDGRETDGLLNPVLILIIMNHTGNGLKRGCQFQYKTDIWS